MQMKKIENADRNLKKWRLKILKNRKWNFWKMQIRNIEKW